MGPTLNKPDPTGQESGNLSGSPLMPRLPSQNRSQGQLVAFIDLLFLLVALFTLLLYFSQVKKGETEQKLEEAQAQLEEAQTQTSALKKAFKAMEPLVEQLKLKQDEEVVKIRSARAKELRRAQRDSVRVDYHILENGAIGYKNREYSLEDFNRLVLAPLRKDYWLALYGQASPQTPFGLVVQARRELLKGKTEFDTYWDSLSSPPPKEPAAP